jgi:hypothetical protein
MGGLPFAGAASRLRGDINTGPGRVEMVQIDPANDTGVTIEIGVSPDSTGELVGRLAFYETVDDGFRATSSKPKEIVVVGSKIKENYSHYFNVQNNISDYEFVKGQASGKRTYGPILFSSAVLPDTIPGYSMTVDSGGTELMMAKNNSDGSSCWIRTSQTHSGSIDSMVSANGVRASKKLDKSTPLIAQALCKNESIDGSFASVDELVGVDDGYSHSIDINDLTSGMHSTTDVDGRDFLVWQRGGSPSASDSVSNLHYLSIDSGYGHSLKLTNGTSTMETVDAADYVVWRKTDGIHNTSGDTAKIATTLSADSGYTVDIDVLSGSSSAKKVNKIDAFTIKQSVKSSVENTSFSSIETSSDSGSSSLVVRAEDDPAVARAGKRLTKAQVIAELSEASSLLEFTDDTDTASVEAKAYNGGAGGIIKLVGSTVSGSMELHLAATPDSGEMRLSNVTADRHLSHLVDDTSEVFEMYQNVIARAKVEKIVMKNTALAGSRLYVGNLGFNTSDGFRVNADLVGGTKVGINVSTPTSTLDVNGTLEIGNGTPISQVLSTTATLDFPSTGGAGGTSDLSISLAGAALGDVVSLGVPAGSVTTQGMFTAWVSAANVVTVRFANLASSLQNPASGTFRAMITKF